jgi:alpha-glucosidase
MDADRVWWRDGVLYQVYPRSFMDANGDGIGDLAGIVERLDHVSRLGVDGIWLNPITPSPNADWGYDVADYTNVDPDLGTLDDVDRLVAEAGRRQIAVVLDLVPNHTSDRHPWFLDSRSSRSSEHRDWYVWADGRADGAPPNNWLSVFGGPAWSLDAGSGQYYLHNFLPEQPDLNWWDEDVRRAFYDVLRFWFDRGIAGFRIDVAHGIVKDHALRDNLPVTEDDHPRIRGLGQRQVYNFHRPEVHDVFRRWRRIADAYDPGRVLIGETWELDIADLPPYYGAAEDELQLAFNFPFALAPLSAEALRPVVEETETQLAARGWPVWTASNHDIGRLATRWCGGDARRVRVALMLLLTLRGTPFLYAGDEIGLPDAVLQRSELRDPVGIRGWPTNPGRDGSRTPMPWTCDEGHGFTRPGVKTWLPVVVPDEGSVADQRDDPASALSFASEMIELRREREDLRRGAYRTLSSPAGTWAYRRGEATTIALALSDDGGRVDVGGGTIVAATDGERVGSRIDEVVALRGWEGVVIGAPGPGGVRGTGAG